MLRLVLLMPLFFIPSLVLIPLFLLPSRIQNRINILTKISDCNAGINTFNVLNFTNLNISDPTTFENLTNVNETELFLIIENMIIYTLCNDSTWQDVIVFDNSTKENWESMLRFGGLNY